MGIEIQILDAIQNIRTPIGDALVPLITALGDKGILWIALAIVLIIIPKTRRAGLTIAIALIIDVILCNCMLKPLVARIRPFEINSNIQLLVNAPTDYSFPSGHTAASFTTAFALLFGGNKKSGIATLIVATLIAFSRLYLYVHYPTDVAGGILIGLLCGWLGNLIVSKGTERLNILH